MQLTTQELALVRQRPQSTRLTLSIFQPRSVLACQVNGAITKNERIIPFDSVSSGDWHSVEVGMTLVVGTSAGARDVGKIRIKSITSSTIVVSENSQINWANDLFLTVLRYWEVWPVYPRIIQDPANSTDVIFYKDYDIAYTNQNDVLGALITAGSHRAIWVGEQTYYSASGTYHVVPGTAMTYDWAFEGGSSITGSASHTPGYVTYNTPGHYVTRLIVTGANGSVDTTYRYVSVYNKPENSTVSNPIKNWSLSGPSGDRGSGGNHGSIRVVGENVNIQDGLPVVLFADDYYGSTNISLGGNALGGAKIFFSGHVLNGSVKFDYQSDSINFEIGNIDEIMKITETYAISLESTASPITKWFQMQSPNANRAIYHYLRWHSTVLSLADFEFVGTDQNTQYFDTDRQSVFDAVDNYMRSALLGTFTSDRQGKLWAEVGAALYSSPTGTFSPVMNISRGDWISEPSITEQLFATNSFIELGGVAYSGSVTGTFSPVLTQAPGSTPEGRGTSQIIEGLTISGQDHINKTAGNLYAEKNYKFPSIDMSMSSDFRNLDIAPRCVVGMNILPTDTAQGISITSPYEAENISWSYDVKNQMLLPSITFKALVDGSIGETITIPPIPDSGGYGSSVFGGGFGGGFSGGIFPALPSTLNPTYTWVINIPTVGGVPGPRLNITHAATSIHAYCVGGTSVTFNIESRGIIGTPGIDISNTEIVATPTGVVGTIANPILLVDSWLWLDISGISGTVSKVVVTLGVV